MHFKQRGLSCKTFNKYFSGMNRWLKLIALCLFVSHAAFAQVTGNAFLDGQSDHSGIKVKVIPVAGAAVLDSTYTAANGSFSMPVVGGIYQVVYSKPGYQSVAYSNGQSFAIPPSYVLNDVVLPAGNNLFVSGTTSGTWTNDNIYIVNGDIIIPEGEVLRVKPGTKIRFNGYYSIIADGALVIEGSAEMPVTIRSNKNTPNQTDWSVIELNGDGSSIDYAVIEHCDWGIRIYNFSPTISNSTIKNCRSGIYANSSTATIRNNKIHDWGNTASVGWGIWVESVSEALVECNEVYAGRGYGGIITKGNDLVRDNEIYDIIGNGMALDNSATSEIYNNLIYNCTRGIQNGCPTGVPTTPFIHNNVILNNEKDGIFFENYHTSGRIVNNVIAGNKVGLYMSYGNPGPSEVSHNLFWGNTKNFDNIPIPGIGVVVGQNANGDDIDSYGNLNQSPQFITENPPIYEPESPVFEAGDTTYYQHIGITVTRECLRIVDTDTDPPTTDTLSTEVLIFPNPSTETFSVLINKPSSSHFGLKLFNSMGQLVAETYSLSGQIHMNRGSLAAGVYTLVLSDDLEWRSTHKIVLR